MRWGAVALALLLAGLGWGAQAQDRPGPPGFPAPDRPVAGIISPEYSIEKTRDGHGEAERVLDRLGIKSGQRVADIGAGLGYYTVRVARRLGPGATIYATDVKAEYLDQLRARLAREGIADVRVILGLPRDPQLPAASVDVTILSPMYHEIENPYEFLYRLQLALVPGARVGIIDMDRPTQRHGTPPTLLRCEVAALGFRQRDFALLAPADGYLAVFTPPETLPAVSGNASPRLHERRGDLDAHGVRASTGLTTTGLVAGNRCSSSRPGPSPLGSGGPRS